MAVQRGAGSKKATKVHLPTDPVAIVFRRPGSGKVTHFHSSRACMLGDRARPLRLAAAHAAGLEACSVCWLLTCPHGVHVDGDCAACMAVTPCNFNPRHVEDDCTCTFQATPEAEAYLRRVPA